MRGHVRLSVVVLLAVGCGASSAEAPPPDPEPIETAETTVEVVPEPTAAERVGTVFEAQMEAIREADSNAFVAAYVDDALLVGPVAQAIAPSRQAAQQMATQVMAGLGTPDAIEPTEHRLVVVEDETSAWSFHEVAITAGEEQATYRASTVYVRDGEDWRIAAQAWTLPLPNERLMQLAQQETLPEMPAREADVGEGAEALAERVSTPGAVFEDPPIGAVLVGTASGELRELTAEMVQAIQSSQAGDPRMVGEPYARVAGSGGCSFAQRIHSMGTEEEHVDVPIRSFAFHVRDGDGWRLAHAHMTVPLPQPTGDDDDGTTDDVDDANDG